MCVKACPIFAHGDFFISNLKVELSALSFDNRKTNEAIKWLFYWFFNNFIPLSKLKLWVLSMSCPLWRHGKHRRFLAPQAEPRPENDTELLTCYVWDCFRVSWPLAAVSSSTDLPCWCSNRSWAVSPSISSSETHSSNSKSLTVVGHNIFFFVTSSSPLHRKV